jgi:hypothetical protein
LLGVCLALACAFGLGRLSSSIGSDDSRAPLPQCADLPGVELDAGLSGTGCITSDGAALQGYRFECLKSSEPLKARSEVGPGPQVVLIPDAGLIARSGQSWKKLSDLAAFHRTPFFVVGQNECAGLRSIPSDWPVRVGCDLDEVRIDLVSLQGCERDGIYYAAIGRLCNYQDGDQRSFWEQWWIDDPDRDVDHATVALETAGPPETWTLIGDLHREERCRVAPKEWPEEWKKS